MSDQLVTIASCRDLIEAQLAKNLLEQAGIKSVLADETTVLMAWYLTNAIGGVKLLVRDSDAREALALLEDWNEGGMQKADLDELPSTGSAPEHVEDGRTERTSQDAKGEQAGELDYAEADEPERELTTREQNADRALRGAIICLAFLPLQFYVLWVLVKMFVSDERLAADKRRKALLAAAINVPATIGFCYLLRFVILG